MWSGGQKHNGCSHRDILSQLFLWEEVAREPAGSKALPEWVAEF